MPLVKCPDCNTETSDRAPVVRKIPRGHRLRVGEVVGIDAFDEVLGDEGDADVVVDLEAGESGAVDEDDLVGVEPGSHLHLAPQNDNRRTSRSKVGVPGLLIHLPRVKAVAMIAHGSMFARRSIAIAWAR